MKKDDDKMVKQFVKQDICPINVLLYVVDRCNFSCPYCYNRMPRHLIEADADIFIKFIEDVRRNTGNRPLNISLIGGEPTLHSRLEEIADHILKLENTTLELLTNFSQPLDFYMKYLEMGVNLAASWHKSPKSAENWDYVEKMKMIPRSFFENNQIEVRIMMENDNWENSKRVFNELYPLYRDYIEISLLTQNNGKICEYTDKQLKEFEQLMWLIKAKREFFTVVYESGKEEQKCFNDMYLNPMVNFHLWRCNAGVDYFYVHVNGDVFNCQSYYEHDRKKLYNIIESDGRYLKEKHKSCICSVDYCSCDFDVYKEKILGRR